MGETLHERVEEEVERTRRRSRWPVGRILAALGVARSSYYRRASERGRWDGDRDGARPRPVQVFEALPEERAGVLAYARGHPGLRHRELAWRMVDEGVACVSPSTVYRILSEAGLIRRWRRREKRYREGWERASRPDQRWASDLLQIKIGRGSYYLITFMDEYSRCIVHHELLTSMDGWTVSVAAQAAVEGLRRDQKARAQAAPEIRSDNGPCYVSKEFRGVLGEHGLAHQRIRPHCPEENGLMERAYRTLREAMEGQELTDLLQAREAIGRIVGWYNTERLHSALGYLRPIDYYRGDPEALQTERRNKLERARAARRQANLKTRRLTPPAMKGRETVAYI